MLTKINKEHKEFTEEHAKRFEEIISKDGVVGLDANSLYPSAMYSRQDFPDLTSAEYIKTDQESFRKHMQNDSRFIVQCDIHIPKDLKFIPVANRKYKLNSFESNGCNYSKGYFYD